MDLRILIVGDDPCYIVPDMQLLRDKGFRVYTIFNYDNLDEYILEVKPHILFYNLGHRKNTLSINSSSLKTNPHTPVIYTIAEDDVYMLIQYTAGSSNKKITLTDSLIAAVKKAIGNTDTDTQMPKNVWHSLPQSIHLYTVRT